MSVDAIAAALAAADPTALAGLAAAALAALATTTLLVGGRRRARAIEQLAAAQNRAEGALALAAETAARGQAETLRLVEARLDALSDRMGERVAGAAGATERSLGALHERLSAIDRAQANIERLSGDVLSLQDILSNKQTRGAFGELQLADLISNALPPDAFALQATLSNGRRVDALIKLPQPPGPIAVDAKFPLEPYEAVLAAERGADAAAAERLFRQAVRSHVAAIAERYLIPGETAEGAIMFLPSEAVYAELHGRFPELVREGFAKRVWITSPTTLMATLTTVRGLLRDARLQRESGALRRELGLLGQDVERLAQRVGALKTHFGQAERDIADIETSAAAATRRLRRLDERRPDDARSRDAGSEAAE